HLRVVVESSLREPPSERHLTALEPRGHLRAGTGPGSLLPPPRGLSEAGADAAAEPFADLHRALGGLQASEINRHRSPPPLPRGGPPSRSFRARRESSPARARRRSCAARGRGSSRAAARCCRSRFP